MALVANLHVCARIQRFNHQILGLGTLLSTERIRVGGQLQKLLVDECVVHKQLFKTGKYGQLLIFINLLT